MTLSLKHTFTSPKGDGGDTTLIRPSNWNAEHTITMATDKLLGRQTAGSGSVEEIACTSFGRSVINAADVATLLALLGVSPASTGDVKLTLKTAADSGWLMCNDTSLGSATSGATYANAAANALFTLIYNNIADADAPIQTSAGAATTRAAQTNAATAWAANCRIFLTKTMGRAIGIAGAGAGLTSRVLGSAIGAESITIATANLPSHSHAVYLNDPGHSHNYTAPNGSVRQDGTQAATVYPPGSGTTSVATTGITIGPASGAGATGNVTATAGSGTALAVTLPTSYMNAMIKL